MFQQHCGIDTSENGEGGKVGEAIYVGTALSQAPEPKLRTGSADNVDADVCGYNWIHHNAFRTYGNECVDIKEGSANNLVENNVCEQQFDPNSGCVGSRGSDNTFRWNEIAECKGAGIRVGGEDGYGEGNHMHGKTIKNAEKGAFNVMSPNQGTVCETSISGVDLIDDQEQFSEAVATGECSSDPGDIGTGSSAPAPALEESDEVDTLLDDSGLEAGIKFTDDAKDSEPEIDVIETTESAGLTGLGSCSTVVEVKQASVLHAEYADSTTEEETEVNGVAIGFFMKAAEEERIQVFDISIMEEGGDDWKTVISRKESNGAMGGVQTFSFSSLTTLSKCAPSRQKKNALFGGIQAIGEELGTLAGEVCSAPTKLVPAGAKASGTDDVRVLFDGNYETRWSTINTQSESDLSNDIVQLTFTGDMRVSSLNIAFFDGHLAHQYFSVYIQSAHAYTWTPVMLNEQAATQVSMQTFSIDLDGVHKIYIVGKGNDVGAYSKFSEVEVYGC
ncbi:secreted protein [Ectocarpus siliculosus]|uniref:Secreted protein n=1 Tax=Ectocarpus siliculosus TaxID=2880 RepID=D7FZ38_ECTSI|nr:secreted protein [Ectocarpus siliculosus]|eukprot:CBJ32655.1 secreted protein [Ectocarpus siliculosus]